MTTKRSGKSKQSNRRSPSPSKAKKGKKSSSTASQTGDHKHKKKHRVKKSTRRRASVKRSMKLELQNLTAPGRQPLTSEQQERKRQLELEKSEDFKDTGRIYSEYMSRLVRKDRRKRKETRHVRVPRSKVKEIVTSKLLAFKKPLNFAVPAVMQDGKLDIHALALVAQSQCSMPQRLCDGRLKLNSDGTMTLRVKIPMGGIQG